MTEQITPYACPWTSEQRIVEIGGGPGLPGTERPMFRPNLDARPGPMVDIVHNLEDTPWPLAGNTYDGIYSAFFLEHVAHKKVRLIIREIYRALAPGGIAVIVTADTWAQCKKIVDAGPEGMDDTLVNMLFGGGEYPENFHRCGFSRPRITQLFLEAGFCQVRVLDHPGIMGPNGYEKVETDMIVEAHKSKARVFYSL